MKPDKLERNLEYWYYAADGILEKDKVKADGLVAKYAEVSSPALVIRKEECNAKSNFLLDISWRSFRACAALACAALLVDLVLAEMPIASLAFGAAFTALAVFALIGVLALIFERKLSKEACELNDEIVRRVNVREQEIREEREEGRSAKQDGGNMPEPPKVVKNFCPSCGKKLENGPNFCPSCGAQVG